MKTNRFIALVAGVLALGVAACGDDVQVVEPTPPQPPPPPPVTATMAPAAASVAVGNSVVFAVNASGGAAGEAASWTCASSNTGIATVTSTSAGCSATGVAAGDVTITASVTKSGETVNVGAQLTVTSDEEPPAPPGDPAFILIQSITGDGGTDVTGLTKRVNVRVGVERGDQELEEVSLLVDGAVVASQSFGGGMDMGMTPPADEAAEQAVHQFTLSFDSHDYDRETGAPVYANGEHTISAALEIGVTMADGMHGHETISSNAITVEFANEDRYELTLATDGNRAMDSDGLMWNSGAVTATVLPVIYSGGQTISQVTLGLRDADDGSVLISSRGGTDPVDPITDDEAPFEVTWANENASSSNQKRVGGIQPGAIVVHLVSSAFSDGTAGPTATPTGNDATDDKPYFMRLDNKGPSVSDINRAMQFNRHYDITNWVGSGHAFTFSSSSTTPDFSDGDGVGRDRSHHQYYAGASTSEDDLVEVSAPSDLDETSNNRAYVLGANVRDLLGNETMVWWAGADGEDGLSNSSTNRGTVDRTDDYKFGVDLTAPTQELVDDDGNIDSTGGVIDNVAILVADRRSVEIDYDDPGTGSGFSGSNAPVHTRIRRFAPNLSAEDGCISGQAYWYSRSRTCEILGDPGSNQWRADPAIRGGTTGSYDFAVQEDGYYAVEYAVMDDAGNRASFIQAGGVIDEAAPVGNALVPAARAIGGRSTLSAFASDNLDLDRVEFYLGFGADAYQMGSESVGSPSLPFEQSANPSISIETLPGDIASAAATSVGLSAHVVRIVDQAGNPTYASSTVAATGTAENILDADAETHNNVNADGDNDGTQTKTITYAHVTGSEAVEDDLAAGETLCWDVDGDGDCADDSEARASLTFSISGTDVVTAATGTAPTDASQIKAEGTSNPFERVVFYVQLDDDASIGGATVDTWAYLGEGRGRAPDGGDVQEDTPATGDTTVATTFSWRLNVRGSQVAAAAGLTAIPTGGSNDGTDTDVTIRAVGYTADGNAVVSAGTDLTIDLSDD